MPKAKWKYDSGRRGSCPACEGIDRDSPIEWHVSCFDNRRRHINWSRIRKARAAFDAIESTCYEVSEDQVVIVLKCPPGDVTFTDILEVMKKPFQDASKYGQCRMLIWLSTSATCTIHSRNSSS